MSERSTGLNNTPLDRRYLNDQDESDYNNSGAHGDAVRALALVRAYKGQIAQENNRPPNTQGSTPGTGGFTGGLAIQQQRQRDKGIARDPDRFENVPSYRSPSNKGDLYQPNDPR